MAENKMSMDIKVFTELVDEIKNSAAECVFPDRALNNTLACEGTNVGREIIEILKEIHKTADIYRTEDYHKYCQWT